MEFFQSDPPAKLSRDKVVPEAGAQPQPTNPDELTGREIAGHYELTQMLGSGAYGIVYKARHKFLNRPVAIKLMPLSKRADERALLRFQREAKAASRLDHPNLVRVLEFGVYDKTTPYMVMDLVEGRPLSKVIAEKGKLSASRASALALQICAALIHAHRKKVIHRDIKPSNIIITDDGHGNEIAKLVDFGIAKLIGPSDLRTTTITSTGEIIGTPLYMSPEQCAEEELDERTDIYSLGCVIYEMVSGRPTVPAENALGAMIAHVNESKLDFEDVDVAPYFRSVIEKCLKRDREQRFANVSQLYKALARSSEEDLVTWLAKLDLTLEQNPTLTTLRTSTPKMVKLLAIFLLGMIAGSVITSGAMTAMNPQKKPESRDWQILMNRANEAYNNASYGEALRYYEQAKEVAKEQGNKLHFTRADQAESALFNQHSPQ
jgi:serine/threonine protein kinase